METIFSLSSVPVLPLWLLMIFAPRWGLTKRIIQSPLIIVPPALLYSILVVPQLLELLPILANPNLNSILGLLSTPQGATIAWVHFLAFDLFVGRWVFLDNFVQQFHIVITGIILFLILMFGPLGCLLYLGLRYFFGKPLKAV